ncbi:MAG TPA: hypothetical protein PLP27_03825 [Crocinitomicaceae bacterium]|nr:hypothetical protein [Crocinitomicaceae bacterium]
MSDKNIEYVRKETSSLGTLIIKQIDKKIAKELIIKNHYSHKWNEGGFGRYNYGVFREESPEYCLGVAVYGLMKVPKANIFTHPNPNGWITELNRLWISDELGKNAETVLIAASIKLLRKDDPNIVAVQSFADGRLGVGTIYKAANFKYYGFHKTIFCRNKKTGEVVHQQLFTNSTSTYGYLKNNMLYVLGDYETFRVNTYRYIYPLDKHFKFFKKEEPYPVYQKGEEPFKWVRNHTAIKNKMVELIYTLKD